MVPFDVIVGVMAVILKEMPHFYGILSVHPHAVKIVINSNAPFTCGTGTNGIASDIQNQFLLSALSVADGEPHTLKSPPQTLSVVEVAALENHTWKHV